jgi:CrcB protein
MKSLLLVFLGGGAGSVARHSIGIILQRLSVNFPVSTLASNLIACIILGFLAGGMALRPGASHETERQLIGIGFCGGLSTYSTFTLETFELLKNGQWALAAAYLIITALACLLAFAAGSAMQR